MGITPFSKSGFSLSDCDCSHVAHETVFVEKIKIKKSTGGNPDPKNWKIIRSEEIGTHLIVMMQYPDCTNYEGKKILLYENTTLIGLLGQKLIDPHFFPNSNDFKYKSPIARFEPTDRGWEMARKLVRLL